MYVIIALRDYLWSPWPKNAYDPYWYLGGGTAAKPNKDAILANSKAKAFFKDYIKFVLNRANSLDGVVYKDDPTIMAWELINEPNFQPDAMRFWLKDMGKTVRSIDGRHLIAVGIGGVENALALGQRQLGGPQGQGDRFPRPALLRQRRALRSCRR